MMWTCTYSRSAAAGAQHTTVTSLLFDTQTPVAAKSLKDFNHKWVTADASVPDGGEIDFNLHK